MPTPWAGSRCRVLRRCSTQMRRPSPRAHLPAARVSAGAVGFPSQIRRPLLDLLPPALRKWTLGRPDGGSGVDALATGVVGRGRHLPMAAFSPALCQQVPSNLCQEVPSACILPGSRRSLTPKAFARSIAVVGGGADLLQPGGRRFRQIWSGYVSIACVRGTFGPTAASLRAVAPAGERATVRGTARKLTASQDSSVAVRLASLPELDLAVGARLRAAGLMLRTLSLAAPCPPVARCRCLVAVRRRARGRPLCWRLVLLPLQALGRLVSRRVSLTLLDLGRALEEVVRCKQLPPAPRLRTQGGRPRQDSSFEGVAVVVCVLSIARPWSWSSFHDLRRSRLPRRRCRSRSSPWLPARGHR